VSDPAQVKALFDSIDHVDLLVTCAGGVIFGKVDEVAPAEWRELFAGRFFGQLDACHYAVPKMPEGSVILLCSGVAGDSGLAEYAGGSALCGAVNAMGRSLAVELAPRGIRVNVLSPGIIDETDIKSNLDADRQAEQVEGLLGRIPAARPGVPGDVADAALFLATNDYTTGVVLNIDGGWAAT
jgi:NAD(P)-dependent dehydrogenase (short-subunit alcohol dehydrogenase family)